MALTRITKGVIKPNENYDTHNINSTGIITATGGNITGNLSVGGVLTYEDVTSIDSVGIITAQKGIHIGAGVSAVGVGTFGGLDIGGDIDVDGHTNLDNVSIAGVTTISSSDLIVKPPTVSSSRIKLGYNEQMKISVSSSNQNVIQSTAAYLQIANNNINLSRTDTNLHMARFLAGQQCKLTYNYIDRIATSGIGATVYGQLDTTDLDVDGHTELDNVNISGVVTATTFIGDGSNLTGVSGFATALSNDQSSSQSVFFKTPKQVNVGAGESIVVQSDATSGNLAFCREDVIHVSTGATMRVATGTQLRMNILNLF